MMEELAQYFAEEEQEFVIDTDQKAEWGLLRLKDDKA